MQFCDYIWNHYEKCIQISTNIPNVGLVICEIDGNFEIFVFAKHPKNDVWPPVCGALGSRECEVEMIIVLSMITNIT